MKLAFFNFLLGAFGSLIVFGVSNAIEGVERFSAPFFVIFIGIICASLSVYFGYYSTLIILVLYALASVG